MLGGGAGHQNLCRIDDPQRYTNLVAIRCYSRFGPPAEQHLGGERAFYLPVDQARSLSAGRYTKGGEKTKTNSLQ